ncbi:MULTISPECIES: spore germination protein [Bacillaceae]|uniref:Spore germination protein n=1 Tax=Evansella alkalicola TaxID=745819 RepID=A0ABS6JT57_9BACI|nr:MULTISPECIES: spore germination protein [Bacillaceae]MBU9721432.1 spore germination protein [Bacillus alkalicola]
MFSKLMKRKQGDPINELSFEEYLSTHTNIHDHLPRSTISVKQKCNEIFSESFDFSERDFHLLTGRSVYICYFSALISQPQLEESVIKPLLQHVDYINNTEHLGSILTVTKYEFVTDWKMAVESILDGNILLHVDQLDPIIVYLAEKQDRTPGDPTTEYQVYGAKFGFIEDSRKNVGIMRQFIKDPRLKSKGYEIGVVSKTQVAAVYLDQYCQPEVLDHLDQLLNSYHKEHLLSIGQLTKYISKHPNSIFPQATMSERPDLVALSLIQGKVALFIDNSTFCVVTPVTLMDLIETSEDHFFLVKWNLLFIRLLRLASLFIGTILPALYVALVAFQPELIPTTLTISVAQSRVQIPLPATAEAFLMMFALDVLIEASIRLPSFVGQTIGIVGGLVIGTAAVEAGIVSHTMVIVIAFTAIALFTMPSWEFVSSWRIIRYLLVGVSTLLGLYGLTLAVGFLLIHLCKLDSMNKPYMYPFAPFDGKRFKTFFLPKR